MKIIGKSSKIFFIWSDVLKYNSELEVNLFVWFIVDFWAIHNKASWALKSSKFSNLTLLDPIKAILKSFAYWIKSFSKQDFVWVVLMVCKKNIWGLKFSIEGKCLNQKNFKPCS